MVSASIVPDRNGIHIFTPMPDLQIGVLNEELYEVIGFTLTIVFGEPIGHVAIRQILKPEADLLGLHPRTYNY
jgi:hypothetical protein